MGQRGWSIAALFPAAELQALDLQPTNAEIAELLSREASDSSYVLQRAYRRAARSAFLWEVEARDLGAQSAR